MAEFVEDAMTFKHLYCASFIRDGGMDKEATDYAYRVYVAESHFQAKRMVTDNPEITKGIEDFKLFSVDHVARVRDLVEEKKVGKI